MRGVANMEMDCPKCWGKNKTCARCGGDGKCPDVQLSPHFRLSELLASNTARAKGLDNDPSAEVLANLKNLCVNVLEPTGRRSDRSALTVATVPTR